MCAKILIVDDEPTLVETVKYKLVREGHEVFVSHDGDGALEMARARQPDLIILDIMLPGLAGLEVCRILRREMVVPTLILTARDDEVDKVVGLEVGADDYMTKPFSMRELLARIGALLRRMRMTERGPSISEGEPTRCIALSDLEINLAGRVVSRGGALLPLSPKDISPKLRS